MHHCCGFNAGSDPSSVFVYLSPRLVYTKLHELEGQVERWVRVKICDSTLPCAQNCTVFRRDNERLHVLDSSLNY